MFNRIAVFAYGVACYAISLATFLYMFGFLGNLGVAKTIDSPAHVPFLQALGIDALLLVVFALQHSVMARPGFKAVWTKIVPSSVERSTYLLFSCAAMFLVMWKWEPMGGVIWRESSASAQLALQGGYVFGWLTVLVTTFLINHFDLFGLRQVTLRLLGRPYTGLAFRTPGPYRLVRHPLYVGWLMVFWLAPLMTSAHLLFAIITTLYILVAIQFEERDLVRLHPEYADYRNRVPMLVPVPVTKQPENDARRRAVLQ